MNLFVSPHQAKKIKELGFDQKCYAWYSGNKFIEEKIENTELLSNDRRLSLAPTKHQIFIWFETEYSYYTNFKTWTNTNEILETDLEIVSWKFPPKKVGSFLNKEEAIDKALDFLIELAEKEKTNFV